MEILTVLGQYLLLAFVLPGFCYLTVFALCFPGLLANVFPGIVGQMRPASADAQIVQSSEGSKKAASQGLWVTLLAIVSGLLLSSVAFSIEILLRRFSFWFCSSFPSIPFNELKDGKASASFFTPEAFMHFNISVGILVLLLIFVIEVTCRGEWSRDKRRLPGARFHVCSPAWLAIGLAVLVVANLHVSSHLFHRVHDIVSNIATQECK
jgi:hypothetical protein